MNARKESHLRPKTMSERDTLLASNHYESPDHDDLERGEGSARLQQLWQQGLEPNSVDKTLRQIRNNFIFKVFGIVALQLLLTTVVGAFFTLNDSARLFILGPGSPLVLLAFAATFGILIYMTCVPDSLHRHPANMILLFVFTALESISVGAVCAMTATGGSGKGSGIVLQALVITAVVVAGLTAFAFQTTYDFTPKSSLLTATLLAVIVASCFRMFLPALPGLQIAFALVTAVVFALMLVVNLQQLIGTKELKVTEDDYIAISLSLYLDVLNLFLSILTILRETDRG